MKNYFLQFTLITFLFAYTPDTKAQKIIGFLGDWHSGYTNYINNTLQYEYLTDVVLAFAIPNADGSISVGANFYTQLNLLRTQLHTKGKKLHFSAGGWSASNYNNGGRRDPDPVQEMMKSESTREIFVSNVLKIVKDYNLDGFNFDWEYPEASDAFAVEEVLISLRIGLNDLEDELGKSLELSIAVSASQTYSVGYSEDAISLVDYVYIMAFDNNTEHHSSVSFAKSGMDYWLNTKNLEPEQLILAIPFYSRNPYGSYRIFSNEDPSAYFNDEDGLLNSYNYNSKPVIEEKINELNLRGGAGVFIWEIFEDRTDEYSLLKVLYSNLVGTDEVKKELEKVEVAPNPIAETITIDLNSGILSSKEIKYSITDITGKELLSGVLKGGKNQVVTSNITSKGLYFLTLKEGANQATYKLIKK